MEVEPNSPAIDDPGMDEDISQNSNSLPGSSEQVTESGALADDEFPELWVEFKCVFCLNDLKTILNPKLLPCLHTACETCLSESNSENGASSSATGKRGRGIKRNQPVRCPSCTQDVVPGEVVDHLFLSEYVQEQQEVGEGVEERCTSCDEGAEGAGFCEVCQEWLCESCVSAHHRVKLTKDHTVRPREDAPTHRNQKYLFCPTHNLEQLKLYCETCDKLTCRDCQLSEHKEHRYQFLQKACEEERSHIGELLAKIREKQGLIEGATANLEKKNEEILERERALHHDIKTFAVRFVSEINKRGKALLDDLTKVCSEKKRLLNVKNGELRSMAERLKHCEKFAEAAITLGSETALVYSKKPIMNQLRRVLKHRCEVPNPSHGVDIQFSYEAVFLVQYISTLGKILVDQLPIGTSANQNQMLPMPASQALVPTNSAVQMQQQPMRPQQMMQPVAQQRMPQRQQMMQQQFTQPLVTSSTDSNNASLRQIMTRPPAYTRNVQQRNTVQPQANYTMQQQQQHHTYRQVAPQQQPMRQQQQQQHHQPQQQQVAAAAAAPQLPMPLRQNKSLSVTAVPSPTKPRSTSGGLSVTPTRGGRGGPQVIVLDDQPKQPTMSTTSRLTHFPSQLASLATTHPNLQIQPADPQVPQLQGEVLKSLLTAPSSPSSSSSVPVLNTSTPEENGAATQVEESDSSDASLPSLESLLRTMGVARHDPNDDYCAVCRDGGELVCCNTCPRVFHRSCHIPNLDVAISNAEPWSCTLCKDVLLEDASFKRKSIDLQGRDLALCERVLLEVMCHPNNMPFQHRVDKKFKNYYRVIKKPMELVTMRNKLSPAHFEHYKNVQEFIDDMILLLKNCYTFNPADSPLRTSGNRIEDTFRELLRKFLPQHAPYFSSDKLD